MHDLVGIIKEDWRVNDRRRVKVLLVFFRLLSTQWVLQRRPFFLPIEALYRVYSEVFLGIELRVGTSIGRGLRIDHGFGLVINKNATMGDFCHLRHGVTIGCNLLDGGVEGESPGIGNFVEFGAGSAVIGDVNIGDNVKIGAGTVVVKSVPSGAVVVGAASRVIVSQRGY